MRFIKPKLREPQFKDAISVNEKKINHYLNHRESVGTDLLKKIIVYTLLMHRTVEEDAFFRHLMGTFWFKETVDLYFNGEYDAIYHQIVHKFLQRGIVTQKDGRLSTTVKP